MPLIEDAQSIDGKFDPLGQQVYDSNESFVSMSLSDFFSNQSEGLDAEHDAVNKNQTTDNKTSPKDQLAIELSALVQNLKQYDSETQEKLKDPSFQKTIFEIFNMLDRSRHGLLCQNGMEPLFEQIHKADKKVSNRGSQIDLGDYYDKDIKEHYKQMFADNEQFTWAIFYKKLFHLEQNQNIAKHDLIIAKWMTANAESFSEGIYTSFYPKRCSKCCIRLLRKKLRQPSDQAYFEGNEQSIGPIYLLMSIKKSLTKSLRHIPKVTLLYMLRDIAYNQLIVKCKYDKAHGYIPFIIISYLIMFSQFQMRYSTLLFDLYFKNDCGQAIKHNPWSWNFKQICSNLFSRFKFLMSISYFGAIRPIVYEIVSILTPIALLLSYVIPNLSMKQIDDFIKQRILRGIFGITSNNILSFDLHDQVLVSFMIDLPLLLLKLSVLLFDCFDIPELYEGYQRDSEGNFIEENGDPIAQYSIHSPLFTCWFSLIITIVFTIQNIVIINDSRKIMSEGFLDYILYGIMGRLGVVPYIEKIKENFSRHEIDPSKDIRSINFNQITVQSIFQDISGSSNKIQVNLIDSSMSELYQCMEKIDIDTDKKNWAIRPVIFFNEALDHLSLELVLSVASQFQKFGCLVDFDSTILDKCLENSIGRNSICNQNKKVLFTLDNEPLLKYLIDQELTEKDAQYLKKSPQYIQFFTLKLQAQCLQMLKILLKKHKFDGYAQLNNGGITLDTYARKKVKSQKYINKYSYNLKKQMPSISQWFDDLDNNNGDTLRSNFKLSFSQIETPKGLVPVNQTSEQLPNQNISSSNQVELQEQEQRIIKKQETQRKYFWFFKELLSGFDLATDIWILSYLSIYHPAWASISISTILAPFFAAYVPFANYLIRGKRLEQRICRGRVLKFITVIPIIIFVMAAMDLVFLTCELARPLLIMIVNLIPYLILGAVFFIISIILSLLYILNLIIAVFADCCKCCKCELRHDYVLKLGERFVNFIRSDNEFWRIFKKYFQWSLKMNYAQEYYSYINGIVFSMDQNDSLFHRSQRVMLQVCLESVPQLFLQAWMLFKIKTVNAEMECDEGKLKLQPKQLWFSFLFAIFNLCFIMIEQYGEAKALKIPTLTYTFMCLNGKFGFIPFIASIKDEKFRREEMIEKPLDFEKIQTTLWGSLHFKFIFKFKNQTCSQFSQSIQQMPNSLSEKETPQINFGNSLDDVDIFEIYLLLKSCHMRVKPAVDKIKLDDKAIQDLTQSIEVGLKKSNITEFGPIIEFFIEENYDDILMQIIEIIDLFQLVKNTFITEKIPMSTASFFSLSDKLPTIYKSKYFQEEVDDKIEELCQQLKQKNLLSYQSLKFSKKLETLMKQLDDLEPSSYSELNILKNRVEEFIDSQFLGAMQSNIHAKNVMLEKIQQIYQRQLHILDKQYDKLMRQIQVIDDLEALEQIKSQISELGIKNQDLFKFSQREVEIQFKKFEETSNLDVKRSLRVEAIKSSSFQFYSAYKKTNDIDYEYEMNRQIIKENAKLKLYKRKPKKSYDKEEDQLRLKNHYLLMQKEPLSANAMQAYRLNLIDIQQQIPKQKPFRLNIINQK